jgi:hypothetical protein
VVKYAKPKKTMLKGFRPLPARQLNPPPGVRPRTIEKMRKLVRESLDNNQLDEQRLFLINYLFTVAQYHLTDDRRWKDRTYLKIQKEGERAHQVGFNQEEITSLNFIVLEEREKGQLKSLEQKLKEKGAK